MKKVSTGMCSELKSKEAAPSRDKKFSWGEPIARHPSDNTPSLTLKSQKAVATPKPGTDLPRNISGHIDLAEVKSNLTTELRSSKNARRRSAR